MASEGPSADESHKAMSEESDCHAKMVEALKLLREDDAEGAVTLVRECAEVNDPRGLWALGLCFEHGVGVDEDREHAAQLYRESASQNSQLGSRLEKKLRKNGGRSQSLELNGERRDEMRCSFDVHITASDEWHRN